MRAALLAFLLVLTPIAGAAPICAAGQCVQHEAAKAGSGSCEASSTSYQQMSLTEANVAAQGYTARLVVQQSCLASNDGRGGSMYSRSTIVDVYTRTPDGFERGVAGGWYSFEQTTPYGSYGDCAMWTQTKNVERSGTQFTDRGCPAGEPPPVVLP